MDYNTQKLNTLFAVILVSASFFLVVGRFQKLDSTRPSQSTSEPYLALGSQTAPARLWQDPFEALKSLPNSAAKTRKSEPPSSFTVSLLLTNSEETDGLLANLGITTNLISAKISLSSETTSPPAGQPQIGPLLNSFRSRTNTAILGVMLEGTPYPEDAEMRRRLRYAVEVALLTSDMAPEDRNHIGVDTLSLTKTNVSLSVTNLDLAFEWFTTKWDKPVLVLWLKEEDFAIAPLQILEGMLTALGGTRDDKPDLYLIGPRSSNTLKAMAEDSTNSFPESKLSVRLNIFSPEATAPGWALFPGETNPAARDWLQGKISGAKPGQKQFQNWIATDDTLCSNLVAELINRRIGPELQADERIVLISEADTFYGRLLPRVFESALTNRCPTVTNNLWHFRYLRGLEGIKPQTKDEKDKKAVVAGTPEELLQAALEKSGEQAEGEAQNDYAQRLAEFLSQEDSRLRRDFGGIKAIGLTGSDVYDKLLLLQALRPKLPQAIFFTTDLDARLWMPAEQLRHTRNLLVASAYPLTPALTNPQLQPLPFRDVYQTAVFTACQGAVHQIETGGSVEPPNLRGGVYEIGRHGPVLLSQPIGTNYGETAPSKSPWKSTLKILSRVRYTLAVFIASVGLLSLTIILLGGFRKTQTIPQSKPKPDLQADSEPDPVDEDLTSRPRWQSFWWIACAVACFLSVSLVAAWISGKPGEEPWSFTDGISIWPTQGFRLLALALSIAFVFIASRRHEKHRDQLWRCFFSTGGGARLPQPFPFPTWFWTWLRTRLERSEQRSQSPSIDEVSDADGKTAWSLLSRLRFWLNGFHEYSTGCHSIRINNWQARTTERGDVDASQLFLDYNHMGRLRFRHARAWIMAVSYLIFGMLCVGLTSGLPDRHCVRGSSSFTFDTVLLGFSILGFLLVLFYTLDAARLAGKMLKHIARPTRWPAWLLRKWARVKCVREQDLDGWLDVQFAVEKTRETGRMLIYPFIIFLLLLLARHKYFDNWSWPASLVLIFAFNFLLAAACWWFVRQSASHVKKRAMEDLNNAIMQIESGEPDRITTPAPVTVDSRGDKREGLGIYTKEAYVKRLGELRQEIEDEKHAAFAHWIQDPTYLALFLPTGVTGLLTIVLGHWLSRN